MTDILDPSVFPRAKALVQACADAVIHRKESPQIDVPFEVYRDTREGHTHGVGKSFGGDLLASTQGEQ